MKVQSAVKPLEIDDTSSQTVTYLHKDIVEKTDDEGNTYYEYEEIKMTKAEYQKYLIKKQRADIDYIALMSGVDLDV